MMLDALILHEVPRYLGTFLDFDVLRNPNTLSRDASPIWLTASGRLHTSFMTNSPTTPPAMQSTPPSSHLHTILCVYFRRPRFPKR